MNNITHSIAPCAKGSTPQRPEHGPTNAALNRAWRRFSLCSLIVLAAISLQAATLKDIVLGDARYQELRLNLQNAGLLDTLAGPGPFTLFAPPDAEFYALGAQYYAALQANTNSLTRVLLYHMLSSSNRWADLVIGPPYTTLEGNTVQVSLNSGTKFVNGLALTNVDQIADNGVLHQIQGILIPPPPPAIQLTSQRTGNQLNLSWTGGKGPFMVQQKTDLNDAEWTPAVPVTSGRSVNVTIASGNVFFRVADTVQLGAGLAAAYEVPPVTSTGFGSGPLSLVGNQLTGRITYGGLPSPVTTADMHGPASTNETAAVLLNLIPAFASSGSTSGSIPNNGSWQQQIPQTLVGALLQGKAYVNFNTVSFPDGNIRGQIMPLP